MDERRVGEEEFRRGLGERLARIETRIEVFQHTLEEIKRESGSAKIAYLELSYTLFGGPKADNVGLIEQFRIRARQDRWLIWIVAACIGFVGKLVSPIYNKIVADWAYNSTTERWIREHSQPHITKIKLYEWSDGSRHKSPEPDH